MLSWRAKQQFKYFSFVAGIALLLLGAVSWYAFSRPGTCSDGKQNNGEIGVDCGGACARLCPFEVSDVIVHWSRIFPAREGFYDAVAFLENPNFNAGVKKFSYALKLYDAKNILVGARTGSTFIAPGERFVIYEDGIRAESGAGTPQRAFFEAEEGIYWESIAPLREKDIIVSETRFEAPRDGGLSRVTTLFTNQSTSDLKDIEAVVLLLDAEGNARDASKTIISHLDAGEARSIVFLLSKNIREAPARIEIYPHFEIKTPTSNIQ